MEHIKKEKDNIQETMTGTNSKYKIYKVNHSTFGGIIYPSDYNTDYRGKDNANGSVIANRIMQDKKFDRQCERNRQIFTNGFYGGTI